ncbi:hypothetical protein DPMN_017865 [Dreissena polymorpha]|uniref:Uncharacterized protein n=1 Tax=Dreissena polymorpha TaxID=45954 RepID=A0A9D4S7S3_DREPO|nr:hypothetical protein DPMN_017865 [Dreissena polymorpha]
MKEIQYRVWQCQGATKLGGFFALANTFSLLSKRTAQCLDATILRQHVNNCIQHGQFTAFPQQPRIRLKDKQRKKHAREQHSDEQMKEDRLRDQQRKKNEQEHSVVTHKLKRTELGISKESDVQEHSVVTHKLKRTELEISKDRNVKEHSVVTHKLKRTELEISKERNGQELNGMRNKLKRIDRVIKLGSIHLGIHKTLNSQY